MRAKLFVGVALCALVIGHAPAPASDRSSIYETLAGQSEYMTLCIAIKEAEEIATLKVKGQVEYTLFAPTDAAFRKLDAETIKKLATNKAAVKQLIRAHIVAGTFTTEELRKHNGKELRTLHGNALKVEETKDGFRVGGAKITSTNIECNNGVIHVIDAVLTTE